MEDAIRDLLPLDLSIRMCRLRHLTDWNLLSLYSPFWRFYCPMESGGGVIYGNTTISLEPGKGYLIPPYTRFSTRLDQPFLKLYAHFSLYLPGVVFSPGIYPLEFTDHEFASLCHLCEETDHDARDVFYVLPVIARGLLELPQEVVKKVGHSERIQRVVDLMKKDFSQPVSNTALAKACHMHETSFIRFFKEKMGTTPQKYQLQLRLEYACELLHYSEQSIEEIAEACGFWDRNHFTRAFRRQWFRPPAEFRRI